MIITEKCPLCGRSHDQAVESSLKKRAFAYLRCPCGLYYADQYMNKAETRAHYADGDYRAKWSGGADKTDHWERDHAMQIVPMVIKEVKTCDRLLDIGCSTGILLEKLQDFYDCTAHGLEWNKYHRAQCNERGIKCFEDFSELSGSYQLIILSHVLEHTLYPLEVLDNVYRLLTGELFVQVPILMLGYPHPLAFTEAAAVWMMMKAGYTVTSTDNSKHFTIWARR